MWKRLMNRKRLLSLSLAAVATFAIILVSYAIKDTDGVKVTAIRAASDGNSGDILLTSTGGDEVVKGLDSTASNPIQHADNQEATHSSYSTDFDGILADDGSTLTQLAGNSNNASNPTIDGNRGKIGLEGDSTDFQTPFDDDSMPILLADNEYTDYDRDVQLHSGQEGGAAGGVTGGQGSITPDSPDKSPSAVPEPSTMFLLGSGLIALAGIGRKLRKG